MKRIVLTLAALLVAAPAAAQEPEPTCVEVAADIPRFAGDTVTFTGRIDRVMIMMGAIVIVWDCYSADMERLDVQYATIIVPAAQDTTPLDSVARGREPIYVSTGMVREASILERIPIDDFSGPVLQIRGLKYPTAAAATDTVMHRGGDRMRRQKWMRAPRLTLYQRAVVVKSLRQSTSYRW